MNKVAQRPAWIAAAVSASLDSALVTWRSDPEQGRQTSLMHLRTAALARQLCLLAEDLRERCHLHTPETRQFLNTVLDPLAELPSRLGRFSGPK